MERLKLRARIIEKFGTIGHFCQRTGLSASAVTNVLKGRNTPSPLAIVGWGHVLDIPDDELDIFFGREVATAQQRETR